MNKNESVLVLLASLMISPVVAGAKYKNYMKDVFEVNGMSKRGRIEPTAEDIEDIESWMNEMQIGKEESYVL